MTVQSEFQRASETNRLIKPECLVIRFIVIVIRFIVIVIRFIVIVIRFIVIPVVKISVVNTKVIS